MRSSQILVQIAFQSHTCLGPESQASPKYGSALPSHNHDIGSRKSYSCKSLALFICFFFECLGRIAAGTPLPFVWVLVFGFGFGSFLVWLGNQDPDSGDSGEGGGAILRLRDNQAVRLSYCQTGRLSNCQYARLSDYQVVKLSDCKAVSISVVGSTWGLSPCNP